MNVMLAEGAFGVLKNDYEFQRFMKQKDSIRIFVYTERGYRSII